MLNILFLITSQVNSTIRAFFIIQNLFFFALFKPIILQFFTILRENLHSFNIHDDQSTRFLCTTIYSIELQKVFMKRIPVIYKCKFCI